MLPRDDHLCGTHLGGCGQRIGASERTLDHIFTRSFFREMNPEASGEDYNRDLNCQPMHLACNGERAGQIHGFPVFSCRCHWLRIDATPVGCMLMLCYQAADGEVELLRLTTERTRIVGGVIRIGDFTDSFGGATEASVYATGTLVLPGPGKRAVAGKGQMGHKLPTLRTDEVEIFNRLELGRIGGDSEHTFQVFNDRMYRNSITVHYEVADS